MNFSENWQIITTVASGASAVVTWITAQLLAAAKYKSSERSDFLTQVNDYSLRQDQRIKDREDQIEQLTKQLIEARLQLSETTHTPPLEVIKSVIDSDVGVMWVKRRVSENNFIMVRVSKGYAKTYLGGSPEIYDNLPDTAVWPTDVAAEFTEADETVYKKQEGIEVIEKITGSKTGTTGYFQGRKYPLRVGSLDLIIGIGQHICEEDAEHFALLHEKQKSLKTKRGKKR